MKQLLLGAALLALTTAGCGAYAFPGGGPSPTPSTGTVSGTVLSVPCAPVEQVGSPCSGRPVQKLEIDYWNGTAVAARTVTDANGFYTVKLPPGTYTVKFANYIMRVISGPTKIAVAAGSNVTANYLLDNGIRVPQSG